MNNSLSQTSGHLKVNKHTVTSIPKKTDELTEKSDVKSP